LSGSQGSRTPSFCFSHKTSDMVNVVSRKCEHLDCTRQPGFNHKGFSKGRLCSLHKEPGMIAINRRKMTCVHDGCDRLPSYNVKGAKKGLLCATHKVTRMVDVVDPTCEHSDCFTRPCFNVPGVLKARFCASHASDGMTSCDYK